MSKALQNYNTRSTSVNQKLPGQVANNAGSFVFSTSDRTRLERFLVLGVDGGTFYVSEKDLTSQNVSWLQTLILRSPQLVLDVVLDVSTSGRAYRNSAAIFTLALMLNHAPVAFRQEVANVAYKVTRTATMVYELASYIENLGGWGRAKRRAVAQWFTSKKPDELAYQAAKYRHRNGWTLRDLMRLSHPVGVDQRVGNFILKGETEWADIDILSGYHYMSKATSLDGPEGVIALLNTYPSLPWETIPTQFLKDPEVWKTLFYNGQLKGQALVRNIVRLSRNGAFASTTFKRDYAKALVDPEMIKKTRLHPMQYLLAGITYEKGQKNRDVDSSYGSSALRTKDWASSPVISEALDHGFYESFKNVVPSGTAIRIGVDVSGSMGWALSNGSDVTAAEGAAAMAVILARSEPYVEIFGFSSTLRDLKIKDTDTLSTVMTKTSNMNYGSTNPSLLLQGVTGIDNFIVITDNEVNQGRHIHRDLQAYRQSSGKVGRMVVVGMTATQFTIADPSDPGMMDVVGFDSAVPKVVTDFMSGKF